MKFGIILLSPINALHVSPCSQLGGSRLSLLTVLGAIDRDRYNPIVALPGAGPVTVELDKMGIPWVAVPIQPFRKGKYIPVIPFAIRALRQAIEHHKIGLVHCNEPFCMPHVLSALTPCGSLSYLRGAGAVHAPRLPIVVHHRLSFDARHIANYRMANAHRIIAVSEACAADFAGFSWHQERVRRVYNGVNLRPFAQATARRDAFRAELGLGSEHFLIGAIGLISSRKRTLEGLEIFRSVHEQFPLTRMLIVGEARHGEVGYEAQVRNFVQEHQLQDAVIFLPWQQRVASCFAALDLHLFLSSDEGFARVVVEAAACRVPTIASNIRPNREAIEPGTSGWIVGDPEGEVNLCAAQEQICRLIEDRETLRNVGERAYQRAANLFSSETCAQGTMSVFDEAIEAHRSGQHVRL